MIRKIILALIGILLVVGAVFQAKKMMAAKQTPKPREKKVETAAFTQIVKNQDIPINITTSGTLMAKNRIELFSETQGIFEKSDRDFKPGVFYKKGDILLRINSDEHRASIRSQKSSLYNQIVLLLPDLKLDYPASFPAWETYVTNFDVNAPLTALPEPVSEKEKLYISGKNILTAYYNVKNLEERLAKFTIRAPFSGVLIEALVDPGALIRAGQKLGEFINTNVYELEVAVNSSYAKLLKVGKQVSLHNVERTQTWKGKVSRVNARVDQASQTIQVFIQVTGKGLKEGAYLEADLKAKEEKNTFEVSRKLLVEDNKLFVVNDTILEIQEILPVYYKEKMVVVKGLEDGTEILAKPIPGAFAGMKVKKFNN